MSDTALLLVDVQNAFLSRDSVLGRLGLPTDRYAAAIPAIHRLLTGARDAGHLVVFTRLSFQADYADAPRTITELQRPLIEAGAMVAGSFDCGFPAAIAPKAAECVIDKQHADGFYGTDLDGVLRRASATDVAVAGVTTGVCVASTARAAAEREYRVCIASDATAERDDALHEASLDLYSQAFGSVRTTDDILRTWNGSD